MPRLNKENKAGLYITVIVHLAVMIVLLIAGLGANLQKENSFVLDFSKYEELERMKAEIERLEEEAEMREAISRRLAAELGEAHGSEFRNVAVDRSALKDDRGTDAEQLYKDAQRLQEELDNGFKLPSEDFAEPYSSPENSPKQEDDKTQTYSGPSVVSYELEGRKASKLSIPAYRCMGEGQVTVLITVNPQGTVTNAKIDDSISSSDSCLRSFAIRAARLSKFSASADAPVKQNGSIVYEFIAQ